MGFGRDYHCVSWVLCDRGVGVLVCSVVVGSVGVGVLLVAVGLVCVGVCCSRYHVPWTPS